MNTHLAGFFLHKWPTVTFFFPIPPSRLTLNIGISSLLFLSAPLPSILIPVRALNAEIRSLLRDDQGLDILLLQSGVHLSFCSVNEIIWSHLESWQHIEKN